MSKKEKKESITKKIAEKILASGDPEEAIKSAIEEEVPIDFDSAAIRETVPVIAPVRTETGEIEYEYYEQLRVPRPIRYGYFWVYALIVAEGPPRFIISPFPLEKVLKFRLGEVFIEYWFARAMVAYTWLRFEDVVYHPDVDSYVGIYTLIMAEEMARRRMSGRAVITAIDDAEIAGLTGKVDYFLSLAWKHKALILEKKIETYENVLSTLAIDAKKLGEAIAEAIIETWYMGKESVAQSLKDAQKKEEKRDWKKIAKYVLIAAGVVGAAALIYYLLGWAGIL